MPQPLIFWQAHVLFLRAIERQSLKQVIQRIVDRGTILNIGRVHHLLKELREAEVLIQTPRKGHAGARYALSAGPAIDAALDQAYEVVKGQSASAPSNP